MHNDCNYIIFLIELFSERDAVMAFLRAFSRKGYTDLSLLEKNVLAGL